MSDIILQLKQYNVNEINYKINEMFDFENAKVVNIRPKFKKLIQKIDKDNLIATLNIIIDDNNEIVPFHLNVTISGVFYMEEWEGEERKGIADKNTIAILFPYLRALVSSITGHGGMPPYILPVLNINSLFKE